MGEVVNLRLYRKRKDLNTRLSDNIELKKTLNHIYKSLKPYIKYRVAYNLISELMEYRQQVQQQITILRNLLKELEDAENRS